MDNKTFKMSFKWVGCATWILKIDDVSIACDPVLCPQGTVQHYGFGETSKRKVEPGYVDGEFEAIDLWLITHEHEDHLDDYGIEMIDPKTRIVSNAKAVRKLSRINPERLSVLKWDQTMTFYVKGMEITIKALPVVHASNVLVARLLGGGNGYWLTIKKGLEDIQIYVTGDTVPHKKVLAALHGQKTDVLIPNMGGVRSGKFGGPLTLNSEGLKKIIHSTHPEVVIPVHFGTMTHFVESISQVRDWNDPKIKIISDGDTCQI